MVSFICNTVWWPPSFVICCLKQLTKLSKKLRTRADDLLTPFHPTLHISAPVMYVGGSRIHSFSSSNKPGPWSLLTIHYNVLCFSWPCYILHQSIFTLSSNNGFWNVSVGFKPPCILIVPFQYHLTFLVRWLLVLLCNDIITQLLTQSHEYT